MRTPEKILPPVARPPGDGSKLHTALAGASDPAIPPSVALTAREFSNYELIEELGRGGMGIVFKARQKSLNRIVALKIITAAQYASEEQVRRFRMEAESAASLSHPNIVAVYERGNDQGLHYYSMELVDGADLGSVMAGHALDAGRAAEYTRDIARGVQHAHEHGILHRDLKLSNILIGQDGRLRITDFGLAKRLDIHSELTLPGQLLGTPACMSPEQVRGKSGDITVASDVYSIGAILYHLLTGAAPFAGESLQEILDKVLQEPPAPPRIKNPAVAIDLDTICLKCLEKNPADRYASARELERDLQRFLDGDPVVARPAARTDFDKSSWANERYSRDYLDEVQYYLPDRERFFQVLRSFFAYYLARRRHVRVCDLGCGDAILAAQILAVDPAVDLTLIDGSRDMLDAARARFGERPDTSFVQATFSDIIQSRVEFGPFDFVMSGLAIHHLEHTEKAALFGRILDALQPGCWFMNFDVTLPDEPSLRAWYTELWRDQISELEKRFKPPRSYRNTPELSEANPDNRYWALAPQLKALRTAGFIEVGCHFRNGIFGMYSGKRPAAV